MNNHFWEVVNIYLPRYPFWCLLNIVSKLCTLRSYDFMLSILNIIWVIYTLECHDNYYDNTYPFCSTEQ